MWGVVNSERLFCVADRPLHACGLVQKPRSIIARPRKRYCGNSGGKANRFCILRNSSTGITQRFGESRQRRAEYSQHHYIAPAWPCRRPSVKNRELARAVARPRIEAMRALTINALPRLPTSRFTAAIHSGQQTLCSKSIAGGAPRCGVRCSALQPELMRSGLEGG
jgi:hypothetical protein